MPWFATRLSDGVRAIFRSDPSVREFLTRNRHTSASAFPARAPLPQDTPDLTFRARRIGLPCIIGHITNPIFPTRVFGIDAALPLLQVRDNLRFAESTHFPENPLGKQFQIVLLFSPVQVWGKLTMLSSSPTARCHFSLKPTVSAPVVFSLPLSAPFAEKEFCLENFAEHR